MGDTNDDRKGGGSGVDRRRFLGTASTVIMAGGLVGGYGTCAALGGRYLYPAAPAKRQWLFVIETAAMARGDAFQYQAPTGQGIAVARLAEVGTVDDFVALSTTCPHLGCQVFWEAENDRFFCPCHNGVFDPMGVAIDGPPSQAGQSLSRFPLKIEAGLLYIQAPVERLARVEPGESERRACRLPRRPPDGPAGPAGKARDDGEPGRA